MLRRFRYDRLASAHAHIYFICARELRLTFLIYFQREVHAKFETALAARVDIDTTTRALFLQEVDRCTALLADLRFETVVEVVLHLWVSDLCDAAVSAIGDAAVSATGDAAGVAVNAMLDSATSFPAALPLRNGRQLLLDAAMLKDAAKEVGNIATTGKRHAKLNALRSVTRALMKMAKKGMSLQEQAMVGITPEGM